MLTSIHPRYDGADESFHGYANRESQPFHQKYFSLLVGLLISLEKCAKRLKLNRIGLGPRMNSQKMKFLHPVSR